jgi:hypothetical protein
MKHEGVFCKPSNNLLISNDEKVNEKENKFGFFSRKFEYSNPPTKFQNYFLFFFIFILVVTSIQMVYILLFTFYKLKLFVYLRK